MKVVQEKLSASNAICRADSCPTERVNGSFLADSKVFMHELRPSLPAHKCLLLALLYFSGIKRSKWQGNGKEERQ